jgi:hypothetical protein
MLTIKNPQKLIGEKYNEVFDIIGVKEHKDYYEFTLGYANNGHGGLSPTETILLHRKQTDNGMYVMEYNSKTLWLNTNEFDTTDKIMICIHTI